MLEPDGQGGVRRGFQRSVETQHGGVVSVHRLAFTHGPAGRGGIVQDSGQFQISLLAGGLGRGHRQGLTIRKLHPEGCQDEVAAVGSGQSAAGHRGMPQRIQPQTGPAAGTGHDGHLIMVLVRIFAAVEQGIIRLHGQCAPLSPGALRTQGPPFVHGCLGEKFLLPRRPALGGFRLGCGESLPLSGQGLIHLREPLRLIRGRHPQHGRQLPIPTLTGQGRLIEKGGQAVVVAFRQRVELVIVAAAAVQSQAQPHRARGLGHIEDVVHAVFLRDAPALAVDRMVPQKPGGQFLLVRGVGEQIAGELPDRELVPRHVAVEGLHHPVAPRPHRAFAVALIAVGVRVAGRLHPVPCHPLAIGPRGQQPIHLFLP